MAGMEFEFKNNSDEIIKQMNGKIEKALEMCGLVAEGYAKSLCPVDTGQLRNSITHKFEKDGTKHVEYIGSDVEYAPYVELGTGVFYDDGGRRSPWTYQDRHGQWHMTNGQRAQPYLRPAVADHVKDYAQIIADELKS